MKIALVSCAKRKRAGIHLAKDLYDSPLFSFAFTYASQNCDKVFILSAKYGMLHPERVVANYDLTLREMSKDEHAHWTMAVFAQISQVLVERDELYFYCGALYRTALMERLSPIYSCHTPLAGLPIGKQLQWYKQNIRQ